MKWPCDPKEVKWVQLEKVCCGKKCCRKCLGFLLEHGPYWYGYWTDHRRQRSFYVGKDLPPELYQLAAAFGRGPLVQGRYDDLPGQTEFVHPDGEPEENMLAFTVVDAANTMGLPWPCTREKARKRIWNQLQAKSRGQDEKNALLAGWQRLCLLAGWNA